MLGNRQEALRDLWHIRKELRGRLCVMEIRWRIMADAGKWKACLKLARYLVHAAPESPFGWIHQAYALHELKRTKEAWDCLLPAITRFPKDYIIAYNLACYACQMGLLDVGRKWLGRAQKMAGEDTIRRMALNDQDLKPLWGEIKGAEKSD